MTHRIPIKLYDDEMKFYKAVVDYIRTGYKSLEQMANPTQKRAAGFLLTTFQKLNSSSTAAIKAALVKRLKRLKGEIDAKTNADGATHDDHDERFEGEYEESEALKHELDIMQFEVDTLEKLVELNVKHDHKLDELLKLVEIISDESPKREKEKILIFTEYRETQRYLVNELEKKYGKGSAVVIHGDMKLERKEENTQDIEFIWRPFVKEGAINTPTTKRTSQRLFRDHDNVRFLVSTEAGGEGINLQFCHICVNYDLPWNPMRLEQRVGRVYRFGQDKVVQVYNYMNKGTIEDLVQSYFQQRLEKASTAIATVTGEDIEEIIGSLNGQLESEIDPSKIYQRAIVEGTLNKQSQNEIKEAVERAKRAYEIATQSLFRDVSSYSFSNYQREIATELTLGDLQQFFEKFLTMHKRQVQRKGGFFEFIVPDILRSYGLPDRYQIATFDREVAIKRSDSDFMALGHPFVDSMLAYVGSYDFGGLTASREIKATELAGESGFLFIFVIRHRLSREDGDEYLFEFMPVFVDAKDKVAEKPLAHALKPGASAGTSINPPDPMKGFQTAKKYVEQKASIWDWDEDVEFVGLSWVVFK